MSVSSDGSTRVGLSTVARIVAERVQNISIVTKTTTLGVGVTVVVSTDSRTTGSSVGRSTIGNRRSLDDSNEKSKDNSVEHFDKNFVDVVVKGND